MAALLAALERGRTRARIGTAAVVVAGVALLGAGAEGYRRWDIARRVSICAAAGAEIDASWNDGARQKLREAFIATGRNHAETSANKVLPWLDEQAAGWRQARTEVCLHADVRALWDADLLNRALWCLEDRQMELAALVAELGRANAMTVQKAVGAAAGLRAAEACLDAALLLRQPAPPAQGRAAIREVRVLLSQAQSLAFGGDLKAALAVAVQAREQARGVRDWPPLLAAARVWEGLLLEKTGAYEAAAAASAEAYFEAARAEAWEIAASSAIDLVRTVGEMQARHEDGRAWALHAEVALTHAGDREGLLEARRLNNLANVHRAAGAHAEARALHERALAIRRQALGPDHPSVAVTLHNLATVHFTAGAYPEARALYERALAISEKALGKDHPDVATSLNNLGVVLEKTGADAEAREMYERALAIAEKALGPDHPDTARSRRNLADMLEEAGARAEARATSERAVQ
jgi:tetratricopeptide (TPR) repeat protein